jgi:glucokinase
MTYAIGIDIGGTNTRIALIDDKYNIVNRIQFSSDPSNPIETIKKISKEVNSFNKEIVGIGVSCPGPLDLINGIVLETPNLPGWWNFPVSNKLSEACELPVYLENDANLAALAESIIGEGRKYRYIQFLTISTGLGSGQVIDKKIYIGAHGYAHEIANMIMWKNGPSQGSILPGGIEAIASGTAITTRAKKAGLEVDHAGEVNDLAKKGNTIAISIMNDAKEYLANCIATLIGVTDPEIVILGGSVALKIDGFTKEVNDLVQTKVHSNLKNLIPVVNSTLSEDSGLLGAACLAFEKAK